MYIFEAVDSADRVAFRSLWFALTGEVILS